MSPSEGSTLQDKSCQKGGRHSPTLPLISLVKPWGAKTVEQDLPSVDHDREISLCLHLVSVLDHQPADLDSPLDSGRHDLMLFWGKEVP